MTTADRENCHETWCGARIAILRALAALNVERNWSGRHSELVTQSLSIETTQFKWIHSVSKRKDTFISQLTHNKLRIEERH